MWESQYDSNKKKTEKTNKQKNKILDGQCLSQIKSDPYETFRKSSCGYPKMITKQNKTNQTNKVNKKQTN